MLSVGNTFFIPFKLYFYNRLTKTYAKKQRPKINSNHWFDQLLPVKHVSLTTLVHKPYVPKDGIETILINSNPATIMTDPVMADHVYLLPLNTKSIVKVLKEHPQIDAVLPTMGGQTALNLCIEADEKGIWEDFGIELIGVDIAAINITEDREQFRELMTKIGVPMAPQATATI